MHMKRGIDQQFSIDNKSYRHNICTNHSELNEYGTGYCLSLLLYMLDSKYYDVV